MPESGASLPSPGHCTNSRALVSATDTSNIVPASLHIKLSSILDTRIYLDDNMSFYIIIVSTTNVVDFIHCLLVSSVRFEASEYKLDTFLSAKQTCKSYCC